MRIVFITIVTLLIFGCNKSKNDIYHNESFENICLISKNKNMPYCIVLTDSTQNLSKEYNKHLRESYNLLTSEAVYNIVDINSAMNEWYVKWLCPVSIPLTCVFSADGMLIDLIPGAARETFLYTEEALKTKNMTGFHWPNQFKKKLNQT